MASDGAEIDLYAEDIEFNQDSEFNDQNVDLYDDVITPSKNASTNAGSGNNGNISGPGVGGGGGGSGGGTGVGSSNSSTHQDDEMSNQADSSNGDLHQHSSSHSMNERDSSSMSMGGGGGKKISLYVGNLTWWTTDQDIFGAIQGVGVFDILEVKFFENRANGQSKGFCLISLGSESSVRAVLDKLPKTEIHAQNPAVTMCSKQNLNHFEMQSRKNQPGGAQGGSNNNNNMNSNGSNNNGPSHSGMRGGMFDGRNGAMSGGMGGGSGNTGNMINRSNSGGGGGGGHNMGPPMMNRPQRQNGPMINNQPNMRMGGGNMSGGFGSGGNGGGMHQGGGGGPMQQNVGSQGWPQHQMSGHNSGSNNGGGQRGGMMHGGNSRTGGPMSSGGPMGMRMTPGGLPSGPRNSSTPLLRAPGMGNDGRLGHGGQMNDWDTHGMHGGGPQGLQGSMGGGPHSGPAPHVNPAFFGSNSSGGGQDHYGRGPSSSGGYGGGYDSRGPLVSNAGDTQMMLQITEAEFEELMNKNRTVSTNAISRAVSDAATGDTTSAIETLMTAISLIKQSKVAGDDRCKFLISSLQDTLHSIETKPFSSSRKERTRSRDRERSRERSSRREKSRRDRSRSRDYRERSRDRYEHRYHDEGSDRYREKERSRDRDRDRDREHRSRH